MKLLFFLLCLFCLGTIIPQTPGCTDPLATNFNSLATQNDGTCLYAPASASIISSWILSDSLQEISGLCFQEGKLYAHNDNGDKKVYRLDTLSGIKTGTYSLSSIRNIDWEEIAEDQNYFYLGDFGNNSGNRNDLKIYRALKSSVFNNNPVIDSILFVYSDQSNFNPPPYSTNFDCEAMIVGQDSIYLFTKQWGQGSSSYYALPKSAGTYTAILKGTVNVQGLITGACYLEQKKLIVLSGYSTLLQPFLFMLYDYSGKNFASGNKRKITLNLPFHQVESATTLNGQRLYISNERFVNGTLTVQQHLHLVDLSLFLQPYLYAGVNEVDGASYRTNLKVGPVPLQNTLYVNCTSEFNYKLYSCKDELLVSGFSVGNQEIRVEELAGGVYILEILISGQYKRFKLVK
jgi:hypothetical protein